MLPGADRERNSVPDAGIPGGPEGARPHLRSAAPRRWRPEGGSGRLGHWAGSGTGWLGYCWLGNWDGLQALTYGNGHGADDQQRGDDTVRFLRVGDAGHEVPVIQDRSGWAYNLSPVIGTGDLDGAFFARGGIDLAVEALDRGELTQLSIEGLRVGHPWPGRER